MRFCLRNAQYFCFIETDLNSSANFLLLCDLEIFSVHPLKLQCLSVFLFLVCLLCEGRRCDGGSARVYFFNVSPTPAFVAVKR